MTRLAALAGHAAADPRADGRLLAAFLADRDEAAFAELVRRHGPLVWAACRRLLPDPHDAEDAFQAVFLVLVRRAHRLTASPSVGPWLYRVAVWTARNLRRKNARRLARTGELPAAVPDPRPAAEPAADLDAALLALSERHRAAVVLCCLQGLTHREAADRLGCAEGTVSARVSRGLAALRARFAGRDPAAVLTTAGVGFVPAAVTAATVRSAAAVQLASLSAAASPAVATLAEGVLRMFWVKKATATLVASVALVAAGLGVGVSVREAPRAVAEEKPVAKPAAPDPMPSGPRLDLEVAGSYGATPYKLTEYGTDGKPVAITLFVGATPKAAVPLQTHLVRIQKADAPARSVHVAIDPEASVALARAATQAVKDAGFGVVEIAWPMPDPTANLIRLKPDGDLSATDGKGFAFRVAVGKRGSLTADGITLRGLTGYKGRSEAADVQVDPADPNRLQVRGVKPGTAVFTVMGSDRTGRR